MDQILEIKGTQIKFLFNEQANSWQTRSLIDNDDIEIEIDFNFHKEKNIDWIHFAEFFEFINKPGRLKELADRSIPLITELGRSFFKRTEAVLIWDMSFRKAFFYNGNESGNYSFSLIFDYFIKNNGEINGDSYGLYLVDFENLQIVGARRIQC